MPIRTTSRDFRELTVWQKAHRLTLDMYSDSKALPKDETFGLTSQMCRAAASIPANIAEGCGRGGRDMIRFCRIASGSASELLYHMLLARDLEYINVETYSRLDRQAQEVRLMLTGLIDRLLEDESDNVHDT
jgi:four helix bundle protein